jgi:hypothetical protein
VSDIRTSDPLDYALDARAMADAVAERDAWIEAQARDIAPHLADVPERINQLLASVQRMLAASDHREAQQYAQEVAREAPTVAHLHVERMRLMLHLMERAPGPTLRVARKDPR